jgi:hypothetical protein
LPASWPRSLFRILKRLRRTRGGSRKPVDKSYSDSSVRFENSAQLVELGLMKTTNAYEVCAVDRGRPLRGPLKLPPIVRRLTQPHR